MATVEKRGKKYRVRYAVYVNGQRVQRNKSFDSAKDAKAFAAKVETDINMGLYAYSNGMTLKELLNEWVTVYCGHLRPNSLADTKVAVDLHINPYIGNIPLERLTTGTIQKLYNDMMQREYKAAEYALKSGVQVMVKPAKTYSAKTVRNVHAVLKQALNHAVRTNLIPRNPCDYVQLPKKEDVEYVIPTPVQLQRLLKDLTRHPAYYPIFTCAVLGCRRGEALGLFWQDIDFTANTVSIRRAYIYNSLTRKNEIGELKTKKARRTLPLPELLKNELLMLKKRDAEICRQTGVDSPFLFIDEAGQPIAPSTCSNQFRHTAQKVGLKGMRLHDLRHTVVTYMLEAGESPRTVQEFVGHSDPGFMLRQYAHVLDSSKVKASNALMQSLFS